MYNPRRFSNHLSSAILLLSSLNYFSSFAKRLYVSNLECISRLGSGFASSFVHQVARAIVHLKQETMNEEIFRELDQAVTDKLPINAIYGYQRFSNFMTKFLIKMHQLTSITRMDLKSNDLQDQKIADQYVLGSKLDQYMEGGLIEDSPILSALGGKYLVMKRCSSCKHMELSHEDFMGMEFQAFTSEDTEHIYSLRKEYEIDSSGAFSIWSALKPFGYYWATIWDVTLDDYLGNHLKHELVQRLEPAHCQKCSQESPVDVAYRLEEIPNFLTIGFRYIENDMEDMVRLRNFLTLDLAKSTSRMYVNNSKNPFRPNFEEDKKNGGTKISMKYNLVVLVAYDDQWTIDNSYVLYTRSSTEGKWNKYTKKSFSQVNSTEVESVVHPHYMVFEREWSPEDKRTKMLNDIKNEEGNPSKAQIPIPDYWVQKLKYLAEPDHLSISHLLCKHNNLRPHYNDIYLNERTEIEITADDQVHITENFSPSKSTKKPSSALSSGKKELSGPKDSFARFALQASATYMGDIATERILSTCATDVDFNTLKQANFSEVCKECFEIERKLVVRRFRESELIGSLNEFTEQQQERLQQEQPSISVDALEESLGPYFLIDSEWIEKWSSYISFAEDNIRAININLFDQFHPPTKIPAPSKKTSTNNPEDQPEFVTPQIMQVLVELYGAEGTQGYRLKSVSSEKVKYTGEYVSCSLKQLDEEQLAALQRTKSILNPEYVLEESELREVCKLEKMRVNRVSKQIEEAIREQRLAEEEEEEEAEEDEGQGQSTQPGEGLSDRSSGNTMDVTRAPNTSGEIELTQIQDEEIRGLMNRSKPPTK